MRKKVIPLAIAGGVLIASGGVLGANAALAKDVQLSVDGVPVQVKTNSGTVGDVLKQRKITVGAKDLVAPSFDQKISDGQSISVRYGRELRLDVDGHKSSTWTTSATVDEALNELSVRDGSEVSASRSTAIPREGMDLTIKTAKQVEIVQNGEAKSYTVLGENVGDGLKNAGIEITDKNVVDPAVTEPLVEGGTITVSTQDVKQTTNETDIDYKTVRKETDSLPKGTEKVQTAGVKGKHIEVWEERFVDGKSVEKKKVSEKTDPQPVDEVVLVGTGKATPDPDAVAEQVVLGVQCPPEQLLGQQVGRRVPELRRVLLLQLLQLQQVELLLELRLQQVQPELGRPGHLARPGRFLPGLVLLRAPDHRFR